MSKTSKKLLNKNNQITAQEIRAVDEDGTVLGVISLSDALQRAIDKNLDLVEIVPNAKPPVCKIMDFGKYIYNQKKKTQNSRKKSKVADIKEIHFRPNIGAHDLEFKLRAIEKFIEKGEKVKISLRFRGREISHSEIGIELIDKVVEKMSDIAMPEIAPKMENNQVTAILVAKKQ